MRRGKRAYTSDRLICTTECTPSYVLLVAPTFSHQFLPSCPYPDWQISFNFQVMLSVYFKIFRVASEREALMRQSLGTCRLSHKLTKTGQSNRNNIRTASAPNSRMRVQMNNSGRVNYSVRPIDYNNRRDSVNRQESRSTECDESPNNSVEVSNILKVMSQLHGISNGSGKQSRNSMERECFSMADLANGGQVCSQNSRRMLAYSRIIYWRSLFFKANEHYHIHGPGKAVRGSKEKMVYLRERKALKTIGIVVMGFIICWMPFFVMYLIEVFATSISSSSAFKLISEFFLWLGYSNSVLNPIIYTMYNGDFRRCFRDLLSFGCVQHHRRTMSVKKLHQQSTIF
ncbi:unnamed protein product [Haemonchus placei]|uniref:G-protein coupled receptors family 1 profile domain-containing protein n=1 Tax=Haemonchus placei TaxID=6290 RepID=A0A3P7YGW0_HAEPC|nr:unnamed protein product [Haemonchus placei]